MAIDVKVDVGSPRGILFGFTDTDWQRHSYLWLKGKDIWLSLLHANRPNTGALKRLIRNLESRKLRVLVPSPIMAMPDILEHLGFAPLKMPDAPCEVWGRKPNESPTQ